MLRRRRRRSRRPAVLAGLIALALAGGGGLLARRRDLLSALPGQERLRALLGRSGGGKTGPPGSEDFTCECGQQYRRTGLDRHRVYWAAGAEEGDPVLGDECVNCGRPLPG